MTLHQLLKLEDDTNELQGKILLGLVKFQLIAAPVFHFSILRSGGWGYLSTVRGTGTCHFLGVLFSNLCGIMGIIFTIF